MDQILPDSAKGCAWLVELQENVRNYIYIYVEEGMFG